MTLDRRRFLVAMSAAATAGAIAGCVEDDDDALDIDDDEVEDDEVEDDEVEDDEVEDDEVEDDEVEDDEEPAVATVTVSDHPEHGDILTDGDGWTLYMFEEDTQDAGESACHDECAEQWPPLILLDEDEPTAGEDVTAELTTFEREDGQTQVAANGWPLYYYVEDEEAGDATGQGFNDVWWVLDPEGTPVGPDETDEVDDTEDDENDE